MQRIGQVESSVERCAILFGIPVDREEFEHAARSGNHSDYMTGLLSGQNLVSAWTGYEPVANAAQSLIAAATKLGAKIYKKACLKDFADATVAFQYIVLFAHWRGTIFRTADFNSGEALFQRMAEHPTLRNIKYMRHNLDSLIDALNEAVENLALLDALPKSVADAGTRTRAVGKALCRDLLDEALSGLAAPGNRVELADGLHTPLKIDNALSAGFSGEIDLALCNSEVLATFIDLRRRNTVRHLHWPDLLNPLPQLLKVEKTLQFMKLWDGDYINTRLWIEEAESRLS